MLLSTGFELYQHTARDSQVLLLITSILQIAFPAIGNQEILGNDS
jgi:hypothetical protein